MTISRETRIALAVVAGILVLSLTLFLVRTWHSYRVTLFFPSDLNNSMEWERRSIPKRKGTEARVEQLVHEIMLGPADFTYARLFPENTKLQTLILRDGNLYLGFSERLAIGMADFPGGWSRFYQILKKNILLTFPSVNSIILDVEGSQIPDSLLGKVNPQAG